MSAADNNGGRPLSGAGSTTDNNGGKPLFEVGVKNCEDLKAIANKSLSDLQKDNPDLLVFPPKLGQYHDDIEDEKRHIFSLHDDTLTTHNILGFIGRNNVQLTIKSRFARDDRHDFFLHYMLGKVLSLNIVNLDTSADRMSVQDFLPYLFPVYFRKALAQGIFKQYQRNEYNDANVRGAIDLNRHIRLNIPFAGKVAYNTREHTYDNSMTELIRHTIEYLRVSPMFSGVLSSDPDMRSDVQKIIGYTPSYNRNDLRKVIDKNRKPVRHPYFTEYLPLQRLCLQILRREKLSFGADKDRIHGLLFDGAWLWEEYLNTILKPDFDHPRNKTKEGREYLFYDEDKRKPVQEIYPDFISKGKNVIADAKYKHLEYSNEEYGREDYFQIITYMYRFDSKHGFLLFPYGETSGSENPFIKNYTIKDAIGRGTVTKLGLAIPQQSGDFKTFCSQIKSNEGKYKGELNGS
jgi:5-methylcytosine-specific restriction endonuclease McrBC regulatory subunit McrC